MSTVLNSAINRFYDAAMFRPRLLAYYGGSDYTNFGYWEPGTTDPRTACDTLMARLLALLPNPLGAVLDVACGKGETTRYLHRHLAPERLVGINISERQLERARSNVPQAEFLLMNATGLRFAEASFDTVFCIEAAFHFDTREAFFAEAFRVLRPGGHLVLTDILVQQGTGEHHERRVEQNFVPDLEAYRGLCEGLGFEVCHLSDATEPCWREHFRHIGRYAHESLLRGELSAAELKAVMTPYYARAEAITHYLLCAARKPT